jgi:hypothetical protein
MRDERTVVGARGEDAYIIESGVMCCGGGHDSCLDMSCRGHAKSFGHIAFDTWMISVVRRSTGLLAPRSVHSSLGLIPRLRESHVVPYTALLKYSKTARVGDGVRLAHGPCSQCSRRELRVLQIIFCALSPVSAIERSVCECTATKEHVHSQLSLCFLRRCFCFSLYFCSGKGGCS